MSNKITKEVEHAIKWLAAEFKYLDKLHEDLENIEKEDIEQQQKDLKKDRKVIRYIRRSETKVGRAIKEIVKEIEKAEKEETSKANLDKLLKEIEVPSAQLLREGSFYVGRLKDELNTIETDVALEKKYPEENIRRKAQTEIKKLKTKVEKLMDWVVALNVALKKAKNILPKDSKEQLDLEEHVLKDPSNKDAWLVYADFLQEIGNPFGELIVQQINLSDEDKQGEEYGKLLRKINTYGIREEILKAFYIFVMKVLWIDTPKKLGDRYRLYNVPFNFPPHNRELHVIDWSKNKLDEGKTKTQENWLKWLKDKEWKLPDFYLINAVIFALWNNREHPDLKQRLLIDKFKKHILKWTLTSTKIEYNPKGKDTIWHNWGSKEEKEVKENIKGPSSIEVSSGDVSEETIYALLGTSNKSEVNDAYAWFGKVPFYIWRLTPETVRTTRHGLIRVVRFDAGSGGVYLVCDGYPSDSYSSVGVQVRVAARLRKHNL